ncbi:hypothetical protein ACFL0C_00550 [Patescibacteria group bacterium]
MKRLTIILVLLVALSVLFYKYVGLRQVVAGPGGTGGNPNFISVDQFNSQLQSSMNVMYTDLDEIKLKLDAQDARITELEQRVTILGN